MSVEEVSDETYEILALIAEMKRQQPYLRVAQIVGNAAREVDGYGNPDAYFLEDEDLYKGLAKMVEDTLEAEVAE